MPSLLQHLHLPPRRVILWHSFSAIPMATVIAFGGFLSFHYRELAQANHERVDQSYQFLSGIGELFASVEVAAVAERDFVITGDNEALIAFNRAAMAIPPELQRVGHLVEQEPDQAAHVAVIETDVAARMREFQDVISVRRSQGFEGARAAIALHASTASMTGLLEKVDLTIQNERRVLADRQVATRRHEQRVVWTGAVVAAVSILVRLLIALWVRRVANRKNTAQSTSSPLTT